MKNCYIYVRTATNSQKELERSNSISNQIKVCKNYAEKNSYEVFLIFEDIGSGNKINSELQNLLSHCDACPPDAVIIKSVDRLSRNMSMLTLIQKELREKQIKLLSVQEGDISGNNFVGNIFASIAQCEYEKHKQLSKKNKK